jgi:hypothetical protein
LDVCAFVVETSLSEDFDHGIVEEGPLREPVCRESIEGG